MSKRKLIWGLVLASVFFYGIQTCNACSPPPVAVLTVEPDETVVGVTVALDGSSSYTLEDDETIVKYEWDFDGDGTYDYTETDSNAPDGLFDGITTHAYSSSGTYTAKLRVTDNRYWWQPNMGTDTAIVHVQEPTWYVDDANGNDDANGLSLSTPFKTVNRALDKDSLTAGDTVIIRGGVYRENIELGRDENKNYWSYGATENSKILIKGYEDEDVLITSMILADDPNLWTHVSGGIYSLDLEVPHVYPGANKIANCSEDGIPLMLMTDYQESGDVSDLTGPGQWVRNSTNWKLYVWSTDGNNPGTHKTEYANFIYAYNSVGSTVYLHANSSDDSNEVDYVTFENLSFEGGWTSVVVGSDNIEFKNCKFSNCYSDAIKVTTAAIPEYGLVQDCNIYHFGESGIDATGANNWLISGNVIHDSVSTQGDLPSGNKVNAIMLKLGVKNTRVEKNDMHDLKCAFGVITFGDGGGSNQVVDSIVVNNLIYNCDALQAVQFVGTNDCSYCNNLVYDCNFSECVVKTRLGSQDPNSINIDLKIKNNIFYNNASTHPWTIWEYQANLYNSIGDGFEFNNNIVDPEKVFFVDNVSYSVSQFENTQYASSLITSEPGFVCPAENNFHYLSDSVMIDAGDPNEPSDPNEYNPYDPNETDFDDNDRVVDGDSNDTEIVDIGPYEYDPNL